MAIIDNKTREDLFAGIKFKPYHFLTYAFASLYIISNLSAIKIGKYHGYFIDLGTIFFPLLYILNDVITEVYGFRSSRKTIWFAIVANTGFVLALSIVAALPSYHAIDSNHAFNQTFLTSHRILLASVTSFLIGEYVNSAILAVTKIKTKGRFFGARAIFSTLIGVTIESILFITIAFYGILTITELKSMIFTLVVIKVLYETFSMPITYKLVKFLKSKENIDYYDYNTRFSILPI